MVNFGPLAAEIGPVVCGTQHISTGFASWRRYCSDVAQRKPTKLCTVFGRLLQADTLHIHFRELLSRYGILPGAKFSLHPPSLALLYFGIALGLLHGT